MLTRTPWAFSDQPLRAAGFSEAAIVQLVGIAAFFNHVTRVADATGIEFDYASPLRRIEVDRSRPPFAGAPTPAPPAAGPPATLLPGFAAALRSWKSQVLESDLPLSRPERSALAARVAELLGDGAAAARLRAEARPAVRLGPALAFVDKLTLEQWNVTGADVAALRGIGFPDEEILAIIAVIASSNAFVRIGLALTEVGDGEQAGRRQGDHQRS